MDPSSSDFEATAFSFLCSSQELPDVGYSSEKSSATLLLQWTLTRSFLYNLSVDGRYGPGTQAAVENYQNKKGIVADGLVGPETWRRIRTGACDRG